jgi:glycosyltransferase involved in cell wall biosynthesis
VYVDLPEELDAAEWGREHQAGLVPDATPYGLHKLAGHGVEPVFSRPLPPSPVRTLAGKVRGRLNDCDLISVGLTALRAERRSADAVLCWDERNGVPGALIPGGPPVVSGGAWLALPSDLHPATRAVTARALPRMAGLFQFAGPVIERIERGWSLPPGTVHRIPMGIDESFYTPEPQRPEDPEHVVASVGDDRHRDHAALVRSIERVARRGVPVHLELATTLPVEVPAELGVVHRRRMGASIREMYRRSTVVALAVRSDSAGSGLTAVTEAMACGRPVVATEAGGLGEYIEHGRTGLLVPPDDDEAFADAVASLLTDTAAASAMGKEGRRVLEERYTTEHTAAALADLLRKVV